MKLLAFDTSTEVLSIAVSRRVDGVARVWQHSGAGGAQASTGLISGVLDLLAQADLTLGELDAICFGAGPGSFTGLRTACSVAQGLAFGAGGGAGVPVLPVDTLLAVAEEARFATPGLAAEGQVMALLDARMDEMYTAHYAYAGAQWTELQGSALLRPQDLQWPATPVVLAGNVFTVYADRLTLPAGVPCIVALPTATAMLRLAPQLLAAGKAVSAAQALPSYIRDKVAKTTAERAAEKAAAQQT
jgi:tRNA threonylcarbamoyladenosine biosynthesis protein TsaB